MWAQCSGSDTAQTGALMNELDSMVMSDQHAALSHQLPIALPGRCRCAQSAAEQYGMHDLPRRAWHPHSLATAPNQSLGAALSGRSRPRQPMRSKLLNPRLIAWNR